MSARCDHGQASDAYNWYRDASAGNSLEPSLVIRPVKVPCLRIDPPVIAGRLPVLGAESGCRYAYAPLEPGGTLAGHGGSPCTGGPKPAGGSLGGHGRSATGRGALPGAGSLRPQGGPAGEPACLLPGEDDG